MGAIPPKKPKSLQKVIRPCQLSRLPPFTASVANFCAWQTANNGMPSASGTPCTDVNSSAPRSSGCGPRQASQCAPPAPCRSPSEPPTWPHRAPPPAPPQGGTPAGGIGAPGPRPAGSATSALLPCGGRESDLQLVSSDTSAGRRRRNTSGSTGIRRKSHGAIKLIADATLEGSKQLLAGLKEINETAKQMKTQEMEMEMRMHQEELEYR
jgi:hypothetical protein